MKRLALLPAAVALVWSTTPARAQPPISTSSPPLAGDASLPSAEASGAALSSQQLYAHVLRGVVAIERNGAPMAIGTVLGGDGRILTSLSGLGGDDSAEVRYSDGTTVHAKVGHSDKVFDLALLVPQPAKWLEGLAASDVDPLGASLRAILPARGAHLGPADVGVKRRTDAHARDGEPLRQMLDVDVKGPVVAGAPLLDSAGSVVAILVRACRGMAQPEGAPWAAWAGQASPPQTNKSLTPCAPVVLGAPVSFIRSFLADIPAQASAPAAWLGIRGTPQATGAVHGVRVVAVAPSSPAQKAGLKAGTDLIVAVDGHSIDTPDKLSESIAMHSPGDSVRLLLFGEDKFREVAVPLQAAP